MVICVLFVSNNFHNYGIIQIGIAYTINVFLTYFIDICMKDRALNLFGLLNTSEKLTDQNQDKNIRNY